jgi:hypothetical protein
MPTHRQQSFLARLWRNQYPVHTLDALEGKPVWVHRLGTPLPPGTSLASTVRNDSAMLGCHPGVVQTGMTFYFRHTAGGYRLYAREPGKHFGKGVYLDNSRHLGLRPTDQYDPSTFDLYSLAGTPLGLMDLKGNTHRITLACHGAAVAPALRASSRYHYLAATGAPAQPWHLQVLERNVPWVSTPDET